MFFSKSILKLDNMKNKISERLKNLLNEEQITVNKFAAELNVSNSVAYYWVQGKTTPNADYIIAIARYFNVSADYLLGLSDI